LHWHKATSFFSFAENSTGVIPGRIVLLHRLIRTHEQFRFVASHDRQARAFGPPCDAHAVDP
jgi:hypothetical protein